MILKYFPIYLFHRLFNDPERKIFRKGSIDSFLMSTPRPLGELQYLRVWTDSSGLGDMSAWYVATYTNQIAMVKKNILHSTVFNVMLYYGSGIF